VYLLSNKEIEFRIHFINVFLFTLVGPTFKTILIMQSTFIKLSYKGKIIPK
jgi:hypothetical protein